MNKKIYSGACKKLLVCGNILALLITISCAALFVCAMQVQSGSTKELLSDKTYRQSETLKDQLDQQSHSLPNYLDLKTDTTSDASSEEYAYYDQSYDAKQTNYRYVIYDDITEKLLDTNMSEKEQAALSGTSTSVKVERSFSNGDHSCTITSTLANPLVVDDEYSTREYYYNMLHPWGMPALIGFIVGAVLWLITLVCLTVTAGHNNETTQIVLCSIDKWKTELAAAFWIFLGGFVGSFTLAGIRIVSSDAIFWIIPDVFIALLVGVLFLVAYLSLVRRMKAHTLWQNSLLKMFCGWCKKIFQNMNLLWRVLVLFGIYFVLTIFFLAVSGPGVLLWLILSGGALFLLVRSVLEKQTLLTDTQIIAAGDLDHKVDLTTLHDSNLDLGNAINNIGDGLAKAVETSVKSERMKADLITNVSHDIKTPLTSIINYVDLLKRENLQNEKTKGYVDILDQKSQRLKQLTDDLVEASKISSGNITLEMVPMDFKELLDQTVGEFEEKFAAKNLHLILNTPETPVPITGDGRRMWRILENIFNNVYKYAMPHTRVYADLTCANSQMQFSLKNISENPLNIHADELTERFIQGDVSRSTEGSGLGLSIAKNLTEVQNGSFQIYLDGDLFKITLTFQLTK